MLLAPGTRIGPYEVVSFIAAGGMGEVYRARDTTLKRDVALKVLPEAFARDPGRMARFHREAEVLASLNHPNIAHNYGVEERALVMELVEGESPKGPMPFDQAWKIASQIAAGLEYAHEKGIVHRDLKPANIKVTPDGVVKILDFGLAKAFTGQAAVSGNPDNSPTLTLGATQLGVILGTAAYMAPEQAKGKAVDKRADIWSFGVVLYELLTGERMFHGEDAAETLAAVIHKQPDLRLVPDEARRLLGECLQKDPKLRLRDIGDARRLLEEGLAPVAAALRSRLGVGVVVTAGVLAVGAAVASFGWWRAIQPVYRPLMKFSAELAQGPNGTFRIDDLTLMHGQPGTFLALTPDGTRLAVQIRDADGKPRLATRRVDENRFTPLPGTENPTSPFFSPDGQWIAFFGDGKLRKIPVHGGAPVVLSSSENFPSGSWGDDNTIIAALNRQGGLSRVSSEGGAPVPITALKS